MADETSIQPQLQDTPWHPIGVKHCACHNLYWRPFSWAPTTETLYAYGYVNRDSWSGDDPVNTYKFTRKEWEALEDA